MKNFLSLTQILNKLFWRGAFENSRWKFDPAFEERLRKEIAKTELLRVKILIGAMLIAFSAGVANKELSQSHKPLPDWYKY